MICLTLIFYAFIQQFSPVLDKRDKCERDVVTSSLGILGRPSHNVRNSRSRRSRPDPDCVKLSRRVRLQAATLNLVPDFIRFTPHKVRLASKLVRLLKRLGRSAKPGQRVRNLFCALLLSLSWRKKKQEKR